MKNKTLNPYVAGALIGIGILLVLSVIITGKFLSGSNAPAWEPERKI